MIISSSDDNSIRFWEVASGKMAYILLHTSEVNFFTISEEQKCIISGNYDDTILIWNYKDSRNKYY